LLREAVKEEAMTFRLASLLLAALAAGALVGARDGGAIQNSAIQSSSGIASPPGVLYGARLLGQPSLLHPTKHRLPVGVTRAPVNPPKAPSPYLCPGGVRPNLPCGTPITEEGGSGYASCTFLNGLNSGCDPTPFPEGGGKGVPDQHQHHHAN
jgi:hypothetical protein